MVLECGLRPVSPRWSCSPQKSLLWVLVSSAINEGVGIMQLLFRDFEPWILLPGDNFQERWTYGGQKSGPDRCSHLLEMLPLLQRQTTPSFPQPHWLPFLGLLCPLPFNQTHLDSAVCCL